MNQQEYVCKLANNQESLKELNVFLAAVGKKHEVSQKTISHIRLALEELIVNIISYGYRDDDAHIIELQTSVNNRSLTFCLSHDGIAFNPLSVPMKDKETSLEKREAGGEGVLLALSFMDSTAYEYKNGKNRLTLTKTVD